MSWKRHGISPGDGWTHPKLSRALADGLIQEMAYDAKEEKA